MARKSIVMVMLGCLAALSPCQAQPAAVQKVGKAVFTLTTFKADGTILASTHGLFTGKDGEAVSSWTPFVGAQRAVCVDADGRQHDVEAVFGANELYNVCRFRVAGPTTAAPIAAKNAASGSKTWLVGYAVKKASAKSYSVSSVETFGDRQYGYYIFADKAAENMEGCPFVTPGGEVIGIMQLAKSGTEMHATDVRYADAFATKGLSINDPVLRQTGIRTALPDDLNDARLTLMMAGEKNDSATYAGYIADFIRQFPTAIDGYSALAQLQLASLDFPAADNTLKTAVGSVANKDEAHSAYASVIMQQQLYLPDSSFTAWSLQRALDEATTANDIRPLAVYQHQQAQIIYALGDYQQAYDRFMALTQSDIRNGELFYEAAQCRTHLGGTTDDVVALLDSAVSVNPDNSISAPYYLARGRVLDEAGQYRQAVQDYNKYDTLMLGRGSDEFYYIKFKAEMRIRQYQQALGDIAHAIVINRMEPTYYAEMASLQLRVNQLDDAIRTADLCIQLEPDYSDPYIVKGIAQGEQGLKAEALATLQKAKELGDERADGLMEKYR